MRAALTLRQKATLIGTAVSAAVLVAGAFLLVTTLENHLVSSTDQLSRSRVQDLLDLAGGGDVPAVLVNIDDNGMAQVVDARGAVLGASANVTGRPAVSRRTSASPAMRTLTGPDDRERERYRVWYRTASTPRGPVTAYVGNSLESAHEASATLRRALWVAVPLAVAAMGLLIWILLGRALGRLDRIRAEVDLISDTNLHVRVRDDGVADEVGRLAATMNAMLARLDDAAQRQRAFVADVSHDLQSPLAAQRVAVEVALEHADRVDTDVLRHEVLGATSEMESMVADLLELAAVDAGVEAAAEPLDLDHVVHEEAARSRAATSVVLDTANLSPAAAFANPGDVRRIVRNLLDNAVRHARGRVVLRVDQDQAWSWVDVIDDGPGIPDEEAGLVFERFYRADPARRRGTGTGTGTGLGLPIARGLARRAGGDIVLVPAASGTHVRLTLPRPG
ncbi:ATP-binding protein [Marmoricola sp. RAF53]|uniref:ATP-binding protein n=1 Tax=Marmoricola sp. RAF53 TaxID=3233059 RepID=UPI003F967674